MAMKKKANPNASNPAGKTSQKVSSSVKVLGKALLPGLGASRTPRASLTNAQMAELTKLANRIKTMESKAAKDKKANARIIKKQNKKPLVPGRGATKTATKETIGTKKKPVIKVTPPRGGGGMRGGGGIGGFGGGLPDYNR